MVFPRPLSSLNVTKHFIPSQPPFPNSSITQKPLIIYHTPFPPSSTASTIEAHLKSVNVVAPQWRYTMYKQHHFHSTTHEVLAIYSGRADLQFGGPGEKSVSYRAEKGDVIVIPAGIGHCLKEDLTGDFGMVGSYPTGAEAWDHCTGGEAGVEERIKGLKWFDKDPIYGDEGPVLDA